MAVLGVITDDSEVVDNFMISTHERLQGHNLVKNPFKGGIKPIPPHSAYIIVIDPLYPPLYWFGFIAFGAAIFFAGISWWMIPGLVLASTYFFYTKWFILMGLFFGLRKAKYKGKIKVVTNTHLLRWLTGFGVS